MLEYKDMSKYREGRERSVPAKIWMMKYKSWVLEDYFYEFARNEETSERVRKMVLEGSWRTAEYVVDRIIGWLNTKDGLSFLTDVFKVDFKPNKKRLMNVWKDYKQSVMTNLIYRYDNHDTVSAEVWNAVNKGSNETAEICVDTIIGWFNSHVGRTFIRDAFAVNIPVYSTDRTN